MADSSDRFSQLSRLIDESTNIPVGETAYRARGAADPDTPDEESFEVKLCGELDKLLTDGETITFNELVNRFPDHAEQLKAAFEKVLSDDRSAAARTADSPLTDAGPPVKAWPGKPGREIQMPESFGRYRIDETIGSGGFGVVYKAWDEQLQRSVAIKVARKLSRSTHSTAAYLDEARFLARLDHTSIVPVFDVGQSENGTLFVVSKYVEGLDLSRRIRQERPSLNDAARIVASIADALDYAHSRGVVHRDVKPGNIIVSDGGHPVLVDFGLAIRDADFGQGATFVGTPSYMSPEQARQEGHRVDGRSDIYSLGVVLYELLTGTRPFNATSVAALLELIRKVEVRPPRQIDRNVPKELERICLKALAKRVADRYSTAGDLADDLRHWATEQQFTESLPSPSTDSASDPTPSTASSRQDAIAIVPRGLRSFESTDSDFFLNLLPGARDRNGLPESIRFWKIRIEDRDETFRAGILLGPSGSGKSSMIRAGLLPRLDHHVHTVIVESRPNKLVPRVLKRVLKEVPALGSVTTLREALAAVRQNHGLPAGRKLLLIFDQFEQWLNYHDGFSSTELVEALGQCDGVRVQALFLIRDDFTLAATQFMDQLEEPLSQTRNFATVDFFGKEHAARVLHAFGRSYGALAERLPKEQQKFIDEAIDGLAEDGHIIPIRISLFAEMVKDKPWTLATLREYGGTRGIGVQFLEEKLAGSGAHPFLRSHKDLTRQILECLMPDESEVLKGPARTRQEMIEQFADQTRPDTLDRVLDLLDSELRLITPAGTGSGISADSESQIRVPAYQLAHDYLVPTIRNWLTADDRSSRRGRARLRLREQSEAWNAKPERRRLPTLLEWISIRRYTRRGEWSAPQRRFMTAAFRHLAVRATAIISLTVIVWAMTWFWNEERQSQAIVERVLNAATEDMPEIAIDVENRAARVLPKLESERLAILGSDESASLDELTDRDRRRILHIALATADAEPEQREFLIEQLPHLTPNELLVVRRFLSPLKSTREAELWEQLETQIATSSRAALSTASLLAYFSPNDDRWSSIGQDLGDVLVATRPFELPSWVEHFSGLGDRISPHLIKTLDSETDLTSVARENAVDLLPAFSADSTDLMASALRESRDDEFEKFFSPLKTHGDEASSSIRRQLDALVAPGGPDMPEVDAKVRSEITGMEGVISASGAMALKVPVDNLESIVDRMNAAGYAVSSLRPSDQITAEFAAITWTRGETESKVAWNVSAQQLKEMHSQYSEAGMDATDVAYVGQPTAQSDSPHFAAVWQRSTTELDSRTAEDSAAEENSQAQENSPVRQESQLVIDCDVFQLSSATQPLESGGLQLVRLAARKDGAGVERMTLLYRPVPADDTESSSFWRARYPATYGELYPGYRQTDCRTLFVGTETADRIPFLQDYLRSADNSRSAYRMKTAESALLADRIPESIELFKKLQTDFPTSNNIARFLAEAYWQAGDLEQFEKATVEYSQTKPIARVEALFEVRRAWLTGRSNDKAAESEDDSEESDWPREAVATLLKYSDNAAANSRGRADLAKGLAIALSMIPETDSESRDKLLNDLDSTLDLVESVDGNKDLIHLLQAPDLSGVRRENVIQSRLQKLGMNRIHVGVWQNTTLVDSEIVPDVAPVEHERRSTQLLSQGFTPVSVSIVRGADEGRRSITSVWERVDPTWAESVERDTELATLSIALARLSENEFLLELLQDTYGSSARNLCIDLCHRFELPAGVLSRMYRRADSSETKRNLLLALGNYDIDSLPPDERANLEARVAQLPATSGHAGLRAAATWVAQQWQLKIRDPQGQPRTDGAWERNPVGQVMIKIPGPVEYVIGAHRQVQTETNNEAQHWVRIDRSFALAETETTVAQFRQFLEDPRVQEYYDHPDRSFSYSEERVPYDSSPQISTRWYDAALYCQWLSEAEELEPEEWCYPEIWDLEPDEPLPIVDDLLERTGYRLPTAAEWEYACRAGSTSLFCYGNSSRLMSRYGWCMPQSKGKAQRVGLLKPNDFGFFDMHGNLVEWCHDASGTRYVPTDSFAIDDTIDPGSTIAPTVYRIVRGGKYGSSATSLRSGAYNRAQPTTNFFNIGFRVARTVRAERP